MTHSDDVPPISTPGTWNVGSGMPVGWSEAVAGWSAAATHVLLDVASTYSEVITYKKLGEAVQTRTGVRTRSLLNNWIGQVLESVALDCHRRGELLLTALCVHQDGTVGEGFAGAASHFSNGVRPADAELCAADIRLLCYQKYALALPADGGNSRLTREEEARRKAKEPLPPPAMCPTHRTVLPKSGQCDDC
ncbi:hypothetical protein ABIB25_003818 [Nakamurella sp. UYEF19]|uniref:hypothetical protein n=1 Tax=Nakamurella sp. UYEF19 TaxID=1756392 RepID=UPI00339A6EF8